MASELRVDTLKDSSGNNSVGMSYVAEGTAKVWMNYKGTTTNSVRDSNNISSVTDEGTGDYTPNITNSMNTADYAVTTATGRGGGNFFFGMEQVRDHATGNYSHQVGNGSGTNVDHEFVQDAVFGDLA